MTLRVDRARAQQRARIARRTRQLESSFAAEKRIRKAKSIPAEWLPTDSLNSHIFKKSTLAELLVRAWTADLVNLTSCYGKTERGCDPVQCDRNCVPAAVDPTPNSVFFFAGVGATSEYRRVFQDGGSACWTFMSSVLASNRKTEDPDYKCKRFLGRDRCSQMRRAVVHFRDDVKKQLVWALIFLQHQPVLAGRRILQNVNSAVWDTKPVGWCKAAAARKRPTHGPFDVNRLVPGDVYLLPTDFSFDGRRDEFMRLDDDGRGLTFLRGGFLGGGPSRDVLVVQQEALGNRTVARIGRLCGECGCHVARSQREHEQHLMFVCKGRRE